MVHIEEKHENKYLIFDSVDENLEIIKNTRTLGWYLK